HSCRYATTATTSARCGRSTSRPTTPVQSRCMTAPEDRYTYVGSELDLFATATTWKAYVRRRLEPYLGREVLEVGAGQGGTTRFLIRPDVVLWVCLEPDPSLAA